jgi:hypothetical protein
MCVQVTKTANRFEISSLSEKILLKNHTRKVACITVVLAIEGRQSTSGLTIPSLYDWCSVFVKRGMLLTVHVQVDLVKRRRERTGIENETKNSTQIKSAFVRKHKCWKVHVALYTPCHIHINKNRSITCFTGK